MKESHADTLDTADSPRRVRLPGFVSDAEIGLGDAVKSLTSAFGVKPCARCNQRAAALNRWLTIGGRPR
jgi:hypothetical protein